MVSAADIQESANPQDIFRALEAEVVHATGYFGVRPDGRHFDVPISMLELALKKNAAGVKTAVVNGIPPVFVGDVVRLYVCTAAALSHLSGEDRRYVRSAEPLGSAVTPFKLEILDPASKKVMVEYRFDTEPSGYTIPRPPGPYR